MSKILLVDDSPIDRRLAGSLLAKRSDLEVELAENGAQALDKMGESPADLVVTDLLMPELDGFELVSAMRVHYPHVPVVLMTAHGTEGLALEALELGAASYVPKSRLAERLLETIDQLLGMAHADHRSRRLHQCRQASQHRFTLENDQELIPPLVELTLREVEQFGLCDRNAQFRLGVAFEEALLNALYRGNLEMSPAERLDDSEKLLMGGGTLADERRAQSPFRDRRIHVGIDLCPQEARIHIRDEGRGFDVTRVPARHESAVLESSPGRGLVLMQSFVDDLQFNDRGNEVTLVKRRAPQEAAA